MLGKTPEGDLLYPLCGVLGFMGYEYTAIGGSWQLQSIVTGEEIALMTEPGDGAKESAMGSCAGLLFLTDRPGSVYVYGEEAYVSASLLEKLGVTCLLVSGTPVIH